ncbi:hypothetical protein LOK49_LG03G02384 [Camellia lanceoleosa]|uniref:Uncharacterized protein n=1 Tax=Camellia lanceoleosa TaxID=1840588 RepID=A0ACC0I7Q0_9ERIC|nr:hypothetical protein LOK49_LG03G02384 [Camellia lanceoleosa]
MALDYIQTHEGVHEDADHAFIGENSTVNLAFNALIYEPVRSPPPSPSMSCMLNWNVNGSKGDIRLFGMLALELFYGRLPISNPNDLDNLVKRVIYGFSPLSKRE